MIPKTIHYCWFGGKAKPHSVIRCIESWKKICPEYKIKEWNERNFDVNITPYTRDAYKTGRYVFVSDYARFYVLYQEGGVYFDTDVEIIRNISPLIECGAFVGWEKPDSCGSHHVAPGLGLAAPKGHSFCKEVLNRFEQIPFFLEDGRRNSYGMMPLMTDLMKEKGLQMNGCLQAFDNLTIYPADFLCPMDSLTGKVTLTKNTYTIHHYDMSWLPRSTRWRVKVMRTIRGLLKR
jgi:hypothetical protein